MAEILMQTRIFTTNRIVLRPFGEQDLSDLYEYCSQAQVGKNAGWARHISMEMSKQVLEDFICNRNQFAIVYRENNKVIGRICIHDDSENNRADTKELGYALNKDYWNRGIMTEVLYLVLDLLFKIGIETVYACCFQSNAASKHLIEKCEFTFEQEGTYFAKPLNKQFKSFEYIYTKSQWNAKNSKDAKLQYPENVWVL